MDFLALYESDLRRQRNKMRRTRQLQRRIFFFVMTMILVIAFSVLLGSLFVNAQSAEAMRSQKFYTSIEVGYGATLTSIAKQYMDGDHYSELDDYIDEVRRINHLPDDVIRAGQYLIVPYYGVEAGTPVRLGKE